MNAGIYIRNGPSGMPPFTGMADHPDHGPVTFPDRKGVRVCTTCGPMRDPHWRPRHGLEWWAGTVAITLSAIGCLAIIATFVLLTAGIDIIPR